MTDAEKANKANNWVNVDELSPVNQYNTRSSYNGMEGKPSRKEMDDMRGVTAQTKGW